MYEPLISGGSVRKLWVGESELYRQHLLRLDADSRRNRFGGAVSDEFIERYAEAYAHLLTEGRLNDQEELPLLQILVIAKDTDGRSYGASPPIAVQKLALPFLAAFGRLLTVPKPPATTTRQQALQEAIEAIIAHMRPEEVWSEHNGYLLAAAERVRELDPSIPYPLKPAEAPDE